MSNMKQVMAFEDKRGWTDYKIIGTFPTLKKTS